MSLPSSTATRWCRRATPGMSVYRAGDHSHSEGTQQSLLRQRLSLQRRASRGLRPVSGRDRKAGEAGGWSRCRRKRFAQEEAVGHEGMDVGVEIEVFAEGVEGENDSGDAR